MRRFSSDYFSVPARISFGLAAAAVVCLIPSIAPGLGLAGSSSTRMVTPSAPERYVVELRQTPSADDFAALWTAGARVIHRDRGLSIALVTGSPEVVSRLANLPMVERVRPLAANHTDQPAADPNSRT